MFQLCAAKRPVDEKDIASGLMDYLNRNGEYAPLMVSRCADRVGL